MSSAAISLLTKMKHTSSHNRVRRPFFKRIGPYMHLLVVLGLAAPIVVYLGIMQALGWRAPVVGSNGTFSYQSYANSDVVMYVSPSTRAYLKGIGGNYDVLLEPWRNYFSQRKFNFREIQDETQLSKYQSGVLILPSSIALSASERSAIMAFHAGGGSILTTWATGTRDGTGGWEGWKFLEGLGTTVLGELPPDTEANHLIMTGESPLSHTLPAGQRIFLTKASESILRFRGGSVAARLMNWARIAKGDRTDEGAIVYSEEASNVGRVASFAFAESVWESHPLTIFPVLDDTIVWLQREPVVLRAAWPNGKRAAQIIEMDTEQGFANANTFANILRAANYPATFYVLTSVGKQFPEILRALANEFEVAYHGDVHISFKGQTAAEQELRLKNMRSEMATAIPTSLSMTGFRAPTEGYDATTEQVLQKMGFRHHAADPNRTDGRLPILVPMENVLPSDTLVVLPRTQRDDINLHWERLTQEQTTAALIEDADQAFNTGALGLLSVHSQNFGPDSPLPQALPALLAHLNGYGRQLWMAPAGQVADWWRDRDRFKMTSNFAGKRLEFNISILGDTPLRGATLTVMLPRKGMLPTIKSTKIGGTLPLVAKLDDYRATIVFDVLTPGNYFYQATFEQ
jgi:peptidoglycan/xylan/chitin deacetylase (PgdA/CDA1 family)